MKKILVINGHPNALSFNFAIAESYKNGAIASGAQVETITIAELKFNPNLQFGYQKRTELEPDLLKSWDKIKNADHLVWIHPVWWDKLLKGKTAHIITTLDQPSWYYRLFFARPSVNQLRKSTLEFCGIKPVKVSYIAVVKTADELQREKWLQQVYKFGMKNK
jgi:NAD(P)H dehydrogenase (quinone)